MSADSDTCPFCGCEFAIGATACPACDLPFLPAEEPARIGSVAVGVALKPEFAVGSLRRVTIAANQAEAEMVEQMLRSQGIPCVVRSAARPNLPDYISPGRRDILVPEGGLAAARDLLMIDDPSAEAPFAPPFALGALILAALGFISLAIAAFVAFT
ncbi:MAG: DUF2007 domain-containing protein [Solirubrobacterales bacterium]